MKKIKLISLIVLMVMLLGTVVYAADSFSLKLTPSVTTANPGQTITVLVSVSNLNITGGDQGLGAYQAKVVYDEERLEFTGISSITTWEIDENEGNLIANTKDGEVVKEETETATLTFKVKETAEEGKAKIELQQIEGAIPDTVEGTSDPIEIEIVKETATPGGETQDPSDEPEKGDNREPSEDQGKDNKITDQIIGNDPSTTSAKQLPKTGMITYLIPAIVFLGITAIIGFVQYRRYKEVK